LLLVYGLSTGKQYAVRGQSHHPIHAATTCCSRMWGNRVYDRARAWKQIHQWGRCVFSLVGWATRKMTGFRSGEHTLLARPLHRAFRQSMSLPVPDTGADTVWIAAPTRRILQIDVRTLGALDCVCRTRTAGVPIPEIVRVCHFCSVWLLINVLSVS